MKPDLDVKAEIVGGLTTFIAQPLARHHLGPGVLLFSGSARLQPDLTIR